MGKLRHRWGKDFLRANLQFISGRHGMAWLGVAFETYESLFMESLVLRLFPLLAPFSRWEN